MTKLKNLKKRKTYNNLNPEFLREGEAIRDFRYPDDCNGSNLKKAYNNMRKLYTPLINKGAKFYYQEEEQNYQNMHQMLFLQPKLLLLMNLLICVKSLK